MSIQPPSAPSAIAPDPADAESRLQETLAVIARQLAAIPGGAGEKRNWYNRLLVELSTPVADMQGTTLNDTNAAEPDHTHTTAIARALGTEEQTRKVQSEIRPSHISLGFYERFRAGAACLTTCTVNGERYILLIHNKTRKESHWEIPAGFMDPLPASDVAVADRKDGGAVVALPEKDKIIAAFSTGSQAAMQQGWRALKALAQNGGQQMQTLENAGIFLPRNPVSREDYDLAPDQNALRETWEEGGIARELLTAAEQAGRVYRVDTQLSLGVGNPGIRPYINNSVYAVDLGELEALPPLTPKDTHEISSAVWVRAGDIRVQNGAYEVPPTAIASPPQTPGELPTHLNAVTALMVEDSMETLLSQTLKQASGGMVDSPSALRAMAHGWTGREREVDTRLIAADGEPKSWLGGGQAAFSAYVEAARKVSASPAETGIAAVLANASPAAAPARTF